MDLFNCQNIEGNPALSLNALQPIIEANTNSLFVSFDLWPRALEIADEVNLKYALPEMKMGKIEVRVLPFLKDDAWCFNDWYSMGTGENTHS